MRVETIITGSYEQNCFLLINEQAECLIIDPGTNANKISSKIAELGVKPKAILLTHGHFDHIAAVNQLASEFNLITYFHEDDLDLTINLKGDIGLVTDPRLLKEYGSDVILSYKTFYSELNIEGFKLDIFHVPGHTPGSVCYAAMKDNIVFTGDFLFKGTIGRTDLKYSNPHDMLSSVKFAKTFPKTWTIYPGHGPITTMEQELNTNEFFLRY